MTGGTFSRMTKEVLARNDRWDVLSDDRRVAHAAVSCLHKSLAPGVEPAEILAMPHEGILRLEYPVVLVREYEKS